MRVPWVRVGSTLYQSQFKYTLYARVHQSSGGKFRRIKVVSVTLTDRTNGGDQMAKGNRTGNGGPKFSNTGREAVLALVAKMDLAGHNQYDIARQIGVEFGEGVTQPQVCQYLKKVRERFILEQGMAREEHVAKSIARLEHMYKEAYEAWCRSKSGMERIVEEHTLKPIPLLPGAKGNKQNVMVEIERKLELVKRTVLREGKAGASEFLGIMERCLAAERDLLGLDAPKRTMNMDIPATTLNWDGELQMKDDVGEELKRVEALPPKKETK